MAGTIKRNSLVRAVREKLAGSLEATASDTDFPDYIFNSKGEVQEIDGDYALVRFYVATPNIWFRVDSLELVE